MGVFDVDPVWIRLAMFLPILLSVFQWIPFMRWTGAIMGDFCFAAPLVIVYIIMWFAVPAPRTARQKLEMNGEKITAQSIRETTEASASCDPDAEAEPIVAEAVVSVFGARWCSSSSSSSPECSYSDSSWRPARWIIGLFALIIGGVFPFRSSRWA